MSNLDLSGRFTSPRVKWTDDELRIVLGYYYFIYENNTREQDYESFADDEKVVPENVLGKVIIKFPQLGRVQFFLASKGGWLVAVMIPALVIIAYDIYKIFRLILLRSKLLDMENKNGNI